MSTPQSALETQAQYQLLAKLASDRNIDLTKLDDGTIAQLYEMTFGKTAEEACPPEMSEEDKKKKEEAEKAEAVKKDESESAEKSAAALFSKAAAEFQAVQAYNAQIKEAQDLGREMARAFVDEKARLEKSAAASPTAAAEKQASQAPAQVSLPALDQLALDYAVKFASDNGFDAEECASRVLAVATLGLASEGSKVASLGVGAALEQGVHVRALEYLEAAGYPVTWGEAAQ